MVVLLLNMVIKRYTSYLLQPCFKLSPNSCTEIKRVNQGSVQQNSLDRRRVVFTLFWVAKATSQK